MKIWNMRLLTVLLNFNSFIMGAMLGIYCWLFVRHSRKRGRRLALLMEVPSSWSPRTKSIISSQLHFQVLAHLILCSRWAQACMHAKYFYMNMIYIYSIYIRKEIMKFNLVPVITDVEILQLSTKKWYYSLFLNTPDFWNNQSVC